MRRTQKEIEEIRQQIGKINTENKSLTDQVNSLKTDPRAIERIARAEMGLGAGGSGVRKDGAFDGFVRGVRFETYDGLTME